MSNTLWHPLSIAGHEWHEDSTDIRHGRGNTLQEERGEDGRTYVNINLDGERFPIAKAILIAMATRGKPIIELERERLAQKKGELSPDVAEKIERLSAWGLPFTPCERCGEPIPYRLVQLLGYLPVPANLEWVPDKPALLKHEALCAESLMKPTDAERAPEMSGAPTPYWFDYRPRAAVHH